MGTFSYEDENRASEGGGKSARKFEVGRPAFEFYSADVSAETIATVYGEQEATRVFVRNGLIELRGYNIADVGAQDVIDAGYLAFIANEDDENSLLTFEEESPQFHITAEARAHRALEEIAKAIGDDPIEKFSKSELDVFDSAHTAASSIIRNQAARRAGRVADELTQYVNRVKINRPWILSHGADGAIAAQLVGFTSRMEDPLAVIRPVVLSASHERSLLPADYTLSSDWLLFEQIKR